ncbi:hypothetical protein [Streptomyces sp. Agncl-13]|uniref:hypothetical protein n=1 Tax=Streptomyces sp. Agncl-13 TaxID=3400628 RepID=UPI003A872662
MTVLPVLADAPASHATTAPSGSSAARAAVTTFRVVSRFSNRCLTANGDNVEVAECGARPGLVLGGHEAGQLRRGEVPRRQER